jgi:hypothetical protein
MDSTNRMPRSGPVRRFAVVAARPVPGSVQRRRTMHFARLGCRCSTLGHAKNARSHPSVLVFHESGHDSMAQLSNGVDLRRSCSRA